MGESILMNVLQRKVKMLIFWCIICFVSVKETFSANILVADVTPSPSHQIWNYAIVEGLLERGHNVTVLSPVSVRPVKHKNFHFLNLKDLFKLTTFSNEELVGGGFIAKMMVFYDYCISACKHAIQSEGFKALMNYPNDFKFDAIIIDVTIGDCFLPLIKKFNYPPSIGITAYLLPATLSFSFGNNVQPSYLPNHYKSYPDQLDFFHRLENYFVVYGEIVLRNHMNKQLIQMFKDNSGEDIGSISDLQNHVSLLLANVDPVLYDPEPLTPNIIPVGGLHIKQKRLPEDLQKIMDTAPHGVILFALGTNMRSADLTPDQREAIIQTFGSLKQTVLWKFESNITGLPKNVIVRKWLSQTDILAHPNLKLFISHGGALSTTEAAYFGVPVIGMPCFADQYENVNNLVRKRVAKKIDFDTLDAKLFLADINDIIYDSQYSQRMSELSKRMKDQPQTPLERAMFWIEYAIRHNGTHFLAPKSRHLPLFVTSCTDIYLFVLTSFFLLLYILKLLFKCFTSNKHKSKRD